MRTLSKYISEGVFDDNLDDQVDVGLFFNQQCFSNPIYARSYFRPRGSINTQGIKVDGNKITIDSSLGATRLPVDKVDWTILKNNLGIDTVVLDSSNRMDVCTTAYNITINPENFFKTIIVDSPVDFRSSLEDITLTLNVNGLKLPAMTNCKIESQSENEIWIYHLSNIRKCKFDSTFKKLRIDVVTFAPKDPLNKSDILKPVSLKVNGRIENIETPWDFSDFIERTDYKKQQRIEPNIEGDIICVRDDWEKFADFNTSGINVVTFKVFDIEVTGLRGTRDLKDFKPYMSTNRSIWQYMPWTLTHTGKWTWIASTPDN